MKQHKIEISYAVFDDIHELKREDARLLEEARKITEQAYAPYSGFYVGAVAMLVNGETVTGTNQENASFPAGLCAERALLAAAAALYPGIAIDTMAISYHNKKGGSNQPVSPCGICRQTLREYEDRVNTPIRLILSGMSGSIFIFEKASLLLPLAFTSQDMR